MPRGERSKRGPKPTGAVGPGTEDLLVQEILECLPGAVVFLNADGRVSVANAAAHALFCRPGERLVGKTRAFCLRRGIFDAAYLAQIDRARDATMYFLDDVAEHDVRVGRRKTHVRAVYRPIVMGGTFRGVVGVFDDRTGAIEAAQLRDDLTSMMFHDMKHPLSAIMLNLDGLLLLGEESLTTQQQEFAESAKHKVQQVQAMFAKMVDIGKLEQQELPLTLMTFDMNDLVEGVLRRTFALQFDKAGKRLMFAPSKHLTPITADATLIRRVLENLVDNAQRHTKRGGTVEVRTARGADRKSVVVHVRDQGRGVPQKFRKVIFEKYRQVHMRKAGVKAGVGLGLAFCKLAVDAHGGDIGITPASGGGADFFFRLPCVPTTNG